VRIAGLRLDQAFRLQRFLDGLTRRHAGHEGAQVRQGRDVDVDELGPVGHGEQVGIRHGEVLAHQVVAAFELLVHPFQAAGALGARHGLGFFGQRGVEEGADALVQFGGDEVEPLHLAVALHRAPGRDQLLVGHLVGDVLHDGRAFAQTLAVVQLEQRHVALGADRVVVGAVGQLVCLGAGQHGREGQAGFAQHDVRAERAGAGAVVELHGVSEKGAWAQGRESYAKGLAAAGGARSALR
jgi:hypothetical protein